MRGRAVAIAVADPDSPEECTRYLVEELGGGAERWVDAAEVDSVAPIFPGDPVLGYVSLRRSDPSHAARRGVKAIRRECGRSEWRLTGIAIDRQERSLLRGPALSRALDRIAEGSARALVIPDPDRLTGRDGTLAALTAAVRRAGGDVVTLNGADTAVSRRAELDDRAALLGRITAMRMDGMGDQAIADALNGQRVAPLAGRDWIWHAWSVREVAGAWPPRGPDRARRAPRSARPPGVEP